MPCFGDRYGACTCWRHGDGTTRFLDGRLRTPSPRRKERRFERLDQADKEHDETIVAVDEEVKRVVGTRNHMKDIQIKKQVNRFTELPQVVLPSQIPSKMMPINAEPVQV